MVTRELKVKPLLEAIEAGTNDGGLMETFHLTVEELDQVLRYLLDSNLVTEQQLTDRLCVSGTQITRAFVEEQEHLEKLD